MAYYIVYIRSLLQEYAMRLEVDWSPGIALSDDQVKHLRYGGVQFTSRDPKNLTGAVITNPEIIEQFQACYSTVLGRVPIDAVKEILRQAAIKVEESLRHPNLMLPQPEEIDIEL